MLYSHQCSSIVCRKRKSIKALQEVKKSDKSIILVTQKTEIDDPEGKDLYQFGCLSKVLQLLKVPDGTVKVLVEGEKRVKILKHIDDDQNYLTCEAEIADDKNTKDLEQLATGLVKKFERLQVLNKKDFNEASNSFKNSKNPSQIANNIASNLNIQIFEKQELLEIVDLKKVRENPLFN